MIHRTLEAKWQKERLSDAQQRAAWNTYVPQHLLPRIHAYELMMAPYAIAHMKIGLKLAETGYDFATEERARVYLTNALEPWLKQLPLIGLDALAHEAAAVNEIKRSKRFTVVVGNPPYSLVSANMEPTHRVLVERYKRIEGTPLKERGALQLEKILNDDYVKFIAKSQDALTSAGAGLMGVITNHAYLDNPTMRGLRHSFLASFAQGYFFDLGGSAKKVSEDVDENVFDIQQGVAIAIAVKGGLASGAGSRHAKLVGVRENKYRILSGSSVEGTGWAELSPSAPYYLFVPTDYELRTDYERFVSLSDVFPLHSIGCFTSKDHFVISRDPRQLVVNAKTFRDSKLADRELCKSLDINPKEAWNVQRSRQQLAGLSDADLAKQVVHFVHRPFDLKYIFFHRSLVWSLAYPVNRNLVKPRNLALVTSRQLATPPWNHVFCASAIVEMFLMSNKTKEGNHVFPLHVLPDDENEQRSFGNEEGHPNLSPAFLAQLSRALALPPVGPHGLPADLTSEDIFNYVYAVFHCPGYRNLYVEFLKIDFPRLPLPGSLELFRALARLGSELTSLHLMESPRLAKPITEFIGAPNPAVEKVSWSKGTVWVDRAQTAGFKGVREDVWNFHIGAYQVCEKWLKDRKGRTLSKGDLAHYQKVVVALAETIRLMEEIDKVIGAHGGWPGAFGTAGGLESVAIQPILQPDEVVEESEPKPRQTKSAPLPMFDGGESDKDSAPDSIDDIDRSDVMAAIRDLLDGPEGAVGIDREEAIRRLAKELGFKRVGSRIKEVLHGDLIAGARRQILETVGGRVRRLTRSIADYDREFLKEQFVASLEGKAWWERDDAIRDFARWLGFRRTGSAIEDTARSLINGLIRTGRLEAEGTQIRKAGR